MAPRKRRPKTKRDQTTQVDANDLTPTFDVDESVAAAVFAHVKNTRDRLALATVSRTWRKVATSDGGWGSCDVVLDGELGQKITDERLHRILRCCRDVKHLEIRDAPRSFAGTGLWNLGGFAIAHELAFTSLETLKFINCTGVSDFTVLEFLRDIGMPDRPKDTRLRCLRLAGCVIDDSNQLDELRECLKVDQNFFEIDKEKISFDLWECICGCVIDTSEANMCVSCHETYSDDCMVDCGFHFCKCCDAFVCNACEENVAMYPCQDCEEAMCESCLAEHVVDCATCEVCEEEIWKTLCNECEDKLNCVDYEHKWLCSECGCREK